MKLLLVSGETPFLPGGGIATYMRQMVPALEAAGHEVFLFTWRERRPGEELVPLVAGFHPFAPERVHVAEVDHEVMGRQFRSLSHFDNIAAYLAPQLWARVEAWDVDVIEATDFQAPCVVLFQQMCHRPGARPRLLTTFNHGMSAPIYRADGLPMSRMAQANAVAERQQMRASDLVVLPAEAMRSGLAAADVTTEAVVVREPYRFTQPAGPMPALRDEVQYLGRVSIGKGVDKLIYAVNMLQDLRPLQRVELIGRIVPTPFQERKMRQYIRKRVRPELRERLSIVDYQPREVALSLLRPGAISPHLGAHETFSYACVEAIDFNQLPVVRAGTPMQEFFPPELQNFVLEEQMRDPGRLRADLAAIVKHGDEIRAGVRAFCNETLAPERAAEALGRAYDAALTRKTGRKTHATARPKASIRDVTVLIPAHNPTAEFWETIDALAAQKSGIPKVIICDDGSAPKAQVFFDYARARLPELTLLQQPNAGLAATRNRLAAACDTELALFLDADDLIAPEFLAEMVNAWNARGAGVEAIVPQRRNFGESDELVLRNLLGDHMHLLENDFRMTALIRTERLREICFDGTRRNGEAEDWAFWLDFTARGYKAEFFAQPGFLYRFRAGSMSWPWSQGQRVGTQEMLRDVMVARVAERPELVAMLARALFERAADAGGRDGD
ncbi:MAG: hypothetical protein CR993_00355 [Rhodobacterales bacterium]|nr:MAG: hypothetical protein CR993_00355 [Rhodobacterales bacterium]